MSKVKLLEAGALATLKSGGLAMTVLKVADGAIRLMASIYRMQSDTAGRKLRVDRIERRLGLNETEQ